MNIHEYQAKKLFQEFGVASSAGESAQTAAAARAIAEKILANGADKLVVKAQIHAGGRGKGVFADGFKGGVHLCDDVDEAEELASKMLGNTLVTKQTGAGGKLVSKVLIAEAVDIEDELYLAILLDRERERPVVITSLEGGVDIEEVSESSPEKIIKVAVHPTLGLQAYQIRKVIKRLALPPMIGKQYGKLLHNLYKLFIACDCSLVEINPLAITPDGELLALDAKFGFDDNALYRQAKINAMEDPNEVDPRELEAAKHELNYIGLDGNVGCMVNGAGLAMATMDIIKKYGGEPANFLDVGGGADVEQVREAFKILVGDERVRSILVNIFGGIMRCDVIAQGVIEAARSIDLKIPLIVRLEGTNVEKGKKMLKDSGLKLQAADELSEAAEMAVQAALI